MDDNLHVPDFRHRPEASARWRMQAAHAISLLPAPARSALWRLWHDVDRMRRHRLEARGDYSRSSPAMHDLDAKLSRFLDLDRPGFFVEVGGGDGYHQSNTYRLERVFNWRGVLVEPVPSLHRSAVRERPGSHVFRCALVAPDYAHATVHLVYGGLMTTVAGARSSVEVDRDWVQIAHRRLQELPEHEFDAPARTLSSVLDESGNPEIDLFSLDVEGFEVQVLRGLDLDRHAPRWILVEIREGATSAEDVEAVLGDRYVKAEQLTPFDILYARTD